MMDFWFVEAELSRIIASKHSSDNLAFGCLSRCGLVKVNLMEVLVGGQHAKSPLHEHFIVQSVVRILIYSLIANSKLLLMRDRPLNHTLLPLGLQFRSLHLLEVCRIQKPLNL